jgi:hypothetical protein
LPYRFPETLLREALNRAMKDHVVRLFGVVLASDDAERWKRFEAGVYKGLSVYREAMNIVDRMGDEEASSS